MSQCGAFVASGSRDKSCALLDARTGLHTLELELELVLLVMSGGGGTVQTVSCARAYLCSDMHVFMLALTPFALLVVAAVVDCLIFSCSCSSSTPLRRMQGHHCTALRSTRTTSKPLRLGPRTNSSQAALMETRLSLVSGRRERKVRGMAEEEEEEEEEELCVIALGLVCECLVGNSTPGFASLCFAIVCRRGTEL